MSETALSGSSNSHSRLAPSGSKCWTRCTKSVSYVAKNRDKILPLKQVEVARLIPYLKTLPAVELYPHEVEVVKAHAESCIAAVNPDVVFKASGNEASRTGTRAHDMAAAVLLGEKQISDLPAEFRPHVKAYVDYCEALVPEGERPFIESKVTLFYSERDDDTGTCDFAVVTSDHVHIADLKYGAGVLVDAIDNEQLAIYALSFIRANDDLYEFHPATKVTMAIVQPRHREGDEVKEWTVSLSELEDFCRPIQEKAEQIRAGTNLEFYPSKDTCRWCDAKTFCEARRNALTEAFDTPTRSGLDFLSVMPDLTKEETALPVVERIAKRSDGETWSDEKLIQIWMNRGNIKALMDDFDELVNARGLGGDTFNDTIKIVMGREGNRAWKDEDAAETFLKGQGLKQDERGDFKLKGPAKIEALLKEKLKAVPRTKTRFEQLITRSAASPVAAPVSDKRPAIQSSLDALPDLTQPETPEP